MCVCAKSLSCVQLFATPWTVARQTSLSMGFSRQVYWSGLPYPPPGNLPDAGIEPEFFCLRHWQEGSLPLAPLGKTELIFSRVSEFYFSEYPFVVS